MNQNYEIKDLDPTEEKEPFYFKCNHCGVILDGIQANDNCLSRDENTCKHWCDKCFKKIKEWIRKQKEEVKEKRKEETQTRLNFNKIENEK